MGMIKPYLVGLMVCLMALTSWANESIEPPSEAQIHRMAQAYYDTQGEWAGKFVLARVLQTRVETVSDKRLVAHLKYEAEFVQARQHKSVDQRTFDIVWQGGRWQVERMGAHQSGRL